MSDSRVEYVQVPGEPVGSLGEVLPIPRPRYEPMTELDYRNVKPPPRFEVKPPDGAPNVVIVLMDQLSYADPAAMGGPIRMPVFERLGKEGLTYTNFHVNALCSPSRMALLTGRNSHQCSVGAVVDASTGYLGDTGVRPDSCATVGEMLRHWGYVTSYFGKCHEVPPYEVSVSGPFDRWPARSGFDKFYGYLAGEQSLLHPNLIDGTTHIGTPRDPDYHFNTDMTDQAIAWVQATRSLTPDRPFLMYYSQSAGHPPHTPPKDWLERDLYKGEFDEGWDVLRERILERQKQLGIVPPDTELAENPEYIKRWDTLSDDEKTVFARQMEVYATLVEHADHEVGRLVDAIDELGELENTLFIYIAGDNGGSSIGEINGVLVEWSALNGAPEDIPYLLSRLDEYGGENSYPNYSVGWAVAGSTPATWCIQMAHGGGNMAGAVVHWPKGIDARGELRSQYTHLIDVVPTILEAVGVPEPKIVNGHEQTPIAGVSMQHSFADAAAPERHTTQYNECAGNRSIYHDGWLAAVVHREPWSQVPRAERFEDDRWELYNTRAGLRARPRPRRRDAREGRGDEGALPRGGDQEQRAPARRPRLRAPEPGRRRTTGPDVRTHRADALPRHDRHDRERLHQHQGRLVHDRRRARHPRRRSRRRHPLPGRPVRRLEPLPQGRQAQVRLQLARPRAVHDRSRRATPVRQGRPPLRGSTTTAADSTKAPPGHSSSAARRSPKDESTRRWALSTHSLPKPPTSASTPTRP